MDGSISGLNSTPGTELLRTILNTVVADDLIPANPCRVRGGGQARRVKRIVPGDPG